VIQLGVRTRSDDWSIRSADSIDTSDQKTILVVLESTSSLDRTVSGTDHPAYPVKAVACRVRCERSIQSQRGCYHDRS
jgi:hypothetical protein